MVAWWPANACEVAVSFPGEILLPPFTCESLPGWFSRAFPRKDAVASYRGNYQALDRRRLTTEGLDFGVWTLGFRVPGFRFRVSGFGFRVSGFGFWVSGFGFRVSSFG